MQRLTDVLIRQVELTVPFPEPCTPYDWITCLEVAEHIPRTFQDTFVANLNCNALKGLILSWAPPGQAGRGNAILAADGVDLRIHAQLLVGSRRARHEEPHEGRHASLVQAELLGGVLLSWYIPQPSGANA